jgi:drug/metabolite transporter (DMT)-like permease
MERKTLGTILALLAAIVSGASVYLNKFAVGQTDAVLFSFLKNSFVLLLISPFLVDFSEIGKALSRKNLPALSFISFLGGGAAFILFFLGLKETSAVSANFFHKSMFLLVLPLSLLLLRKAPSKKKIGIALALLAGNILFWKVANLGINAGDLMILGATLIWAAEAVLSEKLLAGVSPSAITFFRFAGGVPVLFVYLLSTQTNWSLALSAPLWTLGLAGVLAIYSLLYFSAIQRVGAFTATAVLACAPLVTLVLTGTGVSLAQTIGAAVLVGSVAFLSLPVFGTWKTKA